MRPADTRNYRFNPIVVDGTMYVLARNNAIVALDPATGREKWTHRNEGGVTDRGMNYWTSADGNDRRLLYLNAGSLTALDARTGNMIASFGDNGRVDVRTGLHRDVSRIRPLQTNNPGRIYQNLMIVSLPAGGASYLASPGDVHAYDVRTGKLEWVFHMVPEKGEFGADTWPEAALETGSGVHNWAEFTIDEARGIVFIPTGTARYDFYGGNRHGANLFANSIVALDAKTGKRLWHFQTIHHDLWDYDLATSPKLLTVKHDGRDVDVVAQASKHGFVFVFDRVSGQPLWPIEERPVPQSDVPGEQTLADAAVSDAASALRAAVVHRARRQPVSAARGAGESAREAARVGEQGPVHAAEPAGQRADSGQQRRRELGPGRRRSDQGHDVRGVEGAAGVAHAACAWRGGRRPHVSTASADPDVDPRGPTLSQMPQASNLPAGFVPYTAVAPYGNYKDLTMGAPPLGPPWSQITAYDLNKGTILWQVPNGDAPELVARGIKNTGSPAARSGGVVTAGGLIFIGTPDRKFRAYDQDTGKIVWEKEVAGPINGVPAVYEINGREYVVVCVGTAETRGERSEFNGRESIRGVCAPRQVTMRANPQCDLSALCGSDFFSLSSDGLLRRGQPL